MHRTCITKRGGYAMLNMGMNIDSTKGGSFLHVVILMIQTYLFCICVRGKLHPLMV